MFNKIYFKKSLFCLFSLLLISQPLKVIASDSIQVNKADMKLTFRQIIKKYYSNKNFYFGAISQGNYLKKDNKVVDFYNNEFSYNTPENEFKQSSVYPSPSSVWKSATYIGLIDMARRNNQVMRAHAPISPQCSKWAMDDNRTAAELKPVLEYYMTTICKDLEANRDVVKWLDVVNETLSTHGIKDSVYRYKTGDWFGPLLGNERWQNPWTILGFETDTELKVPTYIKLAFQIATQKAPHIKLLYNHHGYLEMDVWDKIKKTVLYLRSQGNRVDAIGWQAHIPYGFEKVPGNLEKLNSLIDWCYQNNLEFHITEIDISMGKNVPRSIFVEKDKEIADTYAAILDTFLKKVGKGAVGFNCWAVEDRFRVVEGAFAGVIDENGQPRNAFYKMKEVLLRNATLSKYKK